MPFKDNSVGVVLASCLPFLTKKIMDAPYPDISLMLARREYDRYPGPAYEDSDFRLNRRIPTMEETARVLKVGGIAVWQGGMEGDKKVAEHNGLELVKYRSDKSTASFMGEPFDVYECVFNTTY